jgi:biotin operon repressor
MKSLQTYQRWIMIGAGTLALACLLTYTLIHTGQLIGRYINPAWIGYIPALGVEFGIVAIALRIAVGRQTNSNVWMFWAVLSAVVVISASANVAEGYQTYYGQKLTWPRILELDPIEAAIGLAATGLVPLIVLALAEVIGQDVGQAVKQMSTDRKRQQKRKRTPVKRLPSFDNPRHYSILTIVQDEPDISRTQLADRLNVSRTTLYDDLKQLTASGHLSSGGQGMKVNLLPVLNEGSNGRNGKL